MRAASAKHGRPLMAELRSPCSVYELLLWRKLTLKLNESVAISDPKVTLMRLGFHGGEDVSVNRKHELSGFYRSLLILAPCFPIILGEVV